MAELNWLKANGILRKYCVWFTVHSNCGTPEDENSPNYGVLFFLIRRRDDEIGAYLEELESGAEESTYDEVEPSDEAIEMAHQYRCCWKEHYAHLSGGPSGYRLPQELFDALRCIGEILLKGDRLEYKILARKKSAMKVVEQQKQLSLGLELPPQTHPDRLFFPERDPNALRLARKMR